jgi:hypothetical protein
LDHDLILSLSVCFTMDVVLLCVAAMAHCGDEAKPEAARVIGRAADQSSFLARPRDLAPPYSLIVIVVNVSLQKAHRYQDELHLVH